MSEERTTEGIIQAWAKEAKEQQSPTGAFVTNGFKIGDNWHNIVAETTAEIEKFKTDAPNGSKVKFIEWSKDNKFWNYKASTFEVLEKGTGFKKAFTPRTRYDSPEQEVREVRGKCLMYAREEAKQHSAIELVRRATMFETFIWLGQKHPIESFASTAEEFLKGFKVDVEKVPELDGGIPEEDVK